ESEADQATDQNRRGCDLGHHERELEQERPHDRADRRVVTEKAVEAIEEVDQHEDRDEGGEREQEGAEELAHQMSAHDRQDEAAAGDHDATSLPRWASSRARTSVRRLCSRSRPSMARS